MNTTRFGELNTGDMFRYISNGNGAGALFRKSSPRDAVQQRADGGGDMHTVDATVKTHPRTAVQRVNEQEKMDNGQRAADLFEQAAKLLETALVLLDMRERDCSDCGTRHFTNRVHAKAYKQFTDTPHQLRLRAAELVEQSNSNGGNQQQAALSAKE